MQREKRQYTIYLASTIITSALLFMGVTFYTINSGVGSESSREILIDRQVDECYARLYKTN